MTVDPGKILLELYEADQEKWFDDRALGTLFDPPFVGVASADDPWFARFKEIIGDFYWTPQEALAGGLAPFAQPLGQKVPVPLSEARARSVISWCLPKTEVARVTNRRQTQVPSREWAYVRTFGEEFLNRLRRGMEARLRALGFAALAPAIVPQNDVKVRPSVGLSSRWSERHTAFVAGLGTFGISGGLITRRGIAHRLGSVVTDAPLGATPRPYGDDAFAWCLKLARGTCGKCIERCPAGSIGPTIQARNKDACVKHYHETAYKKCRPVYGWDGVYGCGLCQTAVPCEDRNPTEKA
jgi:epoxyqueuosine reductase QueG